MTSTIFIRALAEQQKAELMQEAIHGLNQGENDERVIHAVAGTSFRQVPGSPFAYWVTESLRQMFASYRPFATDGRTVRQGLATADDFRFVRAWWEVPATRLLDGGNGSFHHISSFQQWCRSRTRSGRRWVPFAKGGEYLPYYADLHLVVDWEQDGIAIKNFAGADGKIRSRPQNVDAYFRPALTYPLRSHRLAVQPLPAGSIISVRGSGIGAPVDELPIALGLLSSSTFDFLLKVLLGRFNHPQFDMGDIAATPIPGRVFDEGDQLAAVALRCFERKRGLDTANETSHAFVRPGLIQTPDVLIAHSLKTWIETLAQEEETSRLDQAIIDDIAFDLYSISPTDRDAITRSLSGDLSPVTDEDESDLVDNQGDDTDELPPSDPSTAVAAVISFAMGCVLGRWDIRIGLDSTLAPELQGPFDPLPVCSPGRLVGLDGLSAEPNGIVSEEWLRERPDAISLPREGKVAEPTIPDADYPLRIDWDGIIVDDPDHLDDIVRRVREVLHLLWGDRADAIEAESAGILGVKELRDYFRNPKHFWDFHVKRYSKSRRKAPIYWLLQSPKRHYAIWLYYHRLDPDILFKALLNYVEPKIRLEEDRLSGLAARRPMTAAGSETRRLEKAIDQQEAVLSDLHEFRDRLDRAARLHLRPDLDDGVILNIAPLWELVPWKEAKRTWDELLAGKYEWSSIGKQLRERGLV